MKSRAKTHHLFKIALIASSIALLVVVVLWCLDTPGQRYKRASVAHHASPPLGQTALRQYEAIPENPSAIFQKARILDHGILQGPEPVVPNPVVAIGLYRQVAVMGSLREQAQARDRLVELGDSILMNPPPRRQYVPPPVVRVDPNPNPQDVGPQSDSQNVHDSSVVKSVKVSLAKMPPSHLGTETTLVQVRDALKNDHDALRGLDLMEKNTVPLTALKMKEVEVLRKVWGRIQAENDPTRRDDMTQMLKFRLGECGAEASCASGRVARVVDALSTFDENVNLRPLWALRQEMMAKAGQLQSQRSSPDKPFVEELREHFHRDYVVPGLITETLLDAELASWGTDLE